MIINLFFIFFIIASLVVGCMYVYSSYKTTNSTTNKQELFKKHRDIFGIK